MAVIERDDEPKVGLLEFIGLAVAVVAPLLLLFSLADYYLGDAVVRLYKSLLVLGVYWACYLLLDRSRR